MPSFAIKLKNKINQENCENNCLYRVWHCHTVRIFEQETAIFCEQFCSREAFIMHYTSVVLNISRSDKLCLLSEDHVSTWQCDRKSLNESPRYNFGSCMLCMADRDNFVLRVSCQRPHVTTEAPVLI